MKKVLLLFVGVLVYLITYSQKVYFIYLQAENGNPFFVKMSSKIYSSTASGYVILSNLVDSTYTFSIGFPGNQANETNFSVTINKKDKGFLIKTLDNGLSLFDLQSLQISKPISSNTATHSQSGTSKANDFTQLLAKAADDTSLLSESVPVQSKEEISVSKEKPVIPEQKNAIEEIKTAADSTVNEPVQTSVAETEKQEPKPIQSTTIDSVQVEDKVVESSTSNSSNEAVVQATSYKRSNVIKRSESSTTEGFGLVFLDSYDKGTDTIRLIIPNPKIIFAEDRTQKVNSTPGPEAAKPQVTTAPVEKKQPNACKSVASESDFFKLRRAMASKPREEAMVTEAKWHFRKRCFTTEQIKNLSTLFLTSEGKYLFFDAAYLHVSDGNNFKVLESELKDDYYSSRFKALLSNR